MSPSDKEQPRAIAAAENLTVRYGRTLALDSVSLRVDGGTVYALLGRNGAGKTSFIRCLLGHRRPDSGTARCFGLDCWKDRADILARTAVEENGGTLGVAEPDGVGARLRLEFPPAPQEESA